MEKIFYSWKDFDQDILLLGSKIARSNWTPDYIVGIKRGGLIPAIKLSHLLDRPLLVVSCQLRDNHYDMDAKFLEIETVSKDKKFLIVDDICDTGETLEKLIKELKNNGFYNLKTCSLFHNIRQDFVTDYITRKIDRDADKRWIVFPWEF